MPDALEFLDAPESINLESFPLPPRRPPPTLRAFMSKPALGRGLGSLLQSTPAPTPAPESSPAPSSTAGVKLLLHGREEDDEPALSPRSTPWLIPLLLLADALLVAAGGILLFWGAPLARIVAGVVLVLVGGALAVAAVILGARPEPRPTPPRTPSEGAVPKLRVRFVDETPRQRRN